MLLIEALVGYWENIPIMLETVKARKMKVMTFWSCEFQNRVWYQKPAPWGWGNLLREQIYLDQGIDPAVEHGAVDRREKLKGRIEDNPVWLWPEDSCELVLPHHPRACKKDSDSLQDVEATVQPRRKFQQRRRHSMPPPKDAFLQAHQRYMKSRVTSKAPALAGPGVETQEADADAEMPEPPEGAISPTPKEEVKNESLFQEEEGQQQLPSSLVRPDDGPKPKIRE